jgi:hypothetical protein
MDVLCDGHLKHTANMEEKKPIASDEQEQAVHFVPLAGAVVDEIRFPGDNTVDYVLGGAGTYGKTAISLRTIYGFALTSIISVLWCSSDDSRGRCKIYQLYRTCWSRLPRKLDERTGELECTAPHPPRTGGGLRNSAPTSQA